ncbi:3'-5' exonuclease [Desulfonatronovibrio magnus]|uniref:3'-5' exonuclease n=1 Tax=Desulfonatronovibrio magnus TaxID=698827 RepID=UPI0005EB8E76|nr:3'-5' exonuclease [Desulfonatronovibrio magnus]
MVIPQPAVAISSDFFTAFSKVPKNVQSKAVSFLSKFRQDPTSPGINYEKIHHAAHPGFRSVRIGDDYRGIVLKPDQDNVYVLLWIDSHDKAYDWARRKKCAVHPETGSLQVYESQDSDEGLSQEDKNSDFDLPGLFDDIHDRHLLQLGIPQDLLPGVRRIKNIQELEAMLEKFPQEAYEALFFLAEGFTLQEVIEEMDRGEKHEEIDTKDIRSALDKPDSRQRFHVVTDDLELQAMLHAPLEKWRVFLHPNQRKIVERKWNGPVRVLGEAGTGKTVAALHRARWLVRKVFTAEQDWILLTTYTTNLAADIRENLKSICTPQEQSRIEVINMDKWVMNFLKRSGYPSTIVYSGKTDPLWKEAMAAAPEEPPLTEAFYREEWKSVLQPQGVTTFADYCRVSRKGRGVPLNRKSRKAIWPVFEEYRLLLNERGWREVDDAFRDARDIIQAQQLTLPYKAIIVDEAQDMGSQAFSLLRHMVPEGPNDIFIVGDGHQRIYRHKVVLGQCGIKIIGRSKKLRINYRTTEETRRWATSILKNMAIDDLDEGLDHQRGTTSLMRGLEPKLCHFNSFEEECQYLLELIRSKEKDGTLDSTCLIVRTNNILQRYMKIIQDSNIPVYPIKRSASEDRNATGLRIATMHRIKGLEFNTIIIAGANQGILPLHQSLYSTDDPAERDDLEFRERALFYVAATRAMQEVVVTSYGRKSEFLEEVEIAN